MTRTAVASGHWKHQRRVTEQGALTILALDLLFLLGRVASLGNEIRSLRRLE